MYISALFHIPKSFSYFLTIWNPFSINVCYLYLYIIAFHLRLIWRNNHSCPWTKFSLRQCIFPLKIFKIVGIWFISGNSTPKGCKKQNKTKQKQHYSCVRKRETSPVSSWIYPVSHHTYKHMYILYCIPNHQRSKLENGQDVYKWLLLLMLQSIFFKGIQFCLEEICCHIRHTALPQTSAHQRPNSFARMMTNWFDKVFTT